MEINLIVENIKLHRINWYKVININWWAHIKSILTIHKQNITENLYEQIIRNKLLNIYINMGESKYVH